MFGYIQPFKPDLRVKEYEAYKSVYCALCKRLGKDYGVPARLILSFDCTFYAMMLMSVKGECPGFEKGRCTFNPLKKCTYCSDGADALEEAAALSVITFYYKLLDDVNDSSFFKACFKRLLKPLAGHWRKKALKKYGAIDQIVSEMLESQFQAENDPACSIDRAAEPTAVMMAKLMERMAQAEKEKKVFSYFGYYLGKWVYLIDAADDMEKDKKHGSFNPFLRELAGKTPALTKEEESDYCNQVLNLNVSMALPAFRLISLHIFREIIENTVELGVMQMQKKVLYEKKGIPPGAGKADGDSTEGTIRQ